MGTTINNLQKNSHGFRVKNEVLDIMGKGNGLLLKEGG